MDEAHSHVKDVLNSFKWYIHEDDQEEHSEPEDDEADTYDARSCPCSYDDDGGHLACLLRP